MDQDSGLDQAPTAAPSSPMDMMAPSTGPDWVKKDIAPVLREKVQKDEAGLAGIQQQRSRDMAQIDTEFAKTALPTFKDPPHFGTGNPLGDYGVMGMLFATLAGRKTKTPMIAAMNGAAGAIQAAHKGNAEEYERNYKVWTEQNNLAIKEAQLQQQRYRDALEKMQVNQQAGVADLRAAAAISEDKIAAAAAEHGFYGPLQQQMASMERANAAWQKIQPALQLQHAKMDDLFSRPGYHSGDPEVKRKAIQEWERDWSIGGNRVPAEGSSAWYDWYWTLTPEKQKETRELLKLRHGGLDLGGASSGTDPTVGGATPSEHKSGGWLGGWLGGGS